MDNMDISLSEASLKSFDETRLLKIHHKIHFWLYCTRGAAGRQEAAEAGVHFPPKVREHAWWDTAHRQPRPTTTRRWTTCLRLPLFSRHFWTAGLLSSNTREEWRTEKPQPLPFSLKSFLSNFQNNHNKTKEKSAFLEHAFPWCPPENHREGEKGSECYLYSCILSSSADMMRLSTAP